MQIYLLAGVDENERGRIGEGWTKIRGALNKRGRKLKWEKIKGSKEYKWQQPFKSNIQLNSNFTKRFDI